MPFLLPPYFSTLYIHTLKKKVVIFTQGLKIYDLVSRVLFYFLVFLLRLVPVSSVKIIQHSLLLWRRQFLIYVMNKTKKPVKFPLAQPVRNEYAEFLFWDLIQKNPKILVFLRKKTHKKNEKMSLFLINRYRDKNLYVVRKGIVIFQFY